MSEQQVDIVKKKRGRPAGKSSRRKIILEVARASFANLGYAQTTIRKIAQEAGVDVALVSQYFGSKEALFSEVMSISKASLAKIEDAVKGAEAELGKRLTRTFLQLWESSPEESDPMLAMFRSSVVSETSALQLREFIQARLVDVIGPHLPSIPDKVERAGLAISMLVGVAIGRVIIGIPATKALPLERVVEMLAPPIQALLSDTILVTAD